LDPLGRKAAAVAPRGGGEVRRPAIQRGGHCSQQSACRIGCRHSASSRRASFKSAEMHRLWARYSIYRRRLHAHHNLFGIRPVHHAPRGRSGLNPGGHAGTLGTRFLTNAGLRRGHAAGRRTFSSSDTRGDENRCGRFHSTLDRGKRPSNQPRASPNLSQYGSRVRLAHRTDTHSFDNQIPSSAALCPRPLALRARAVVENNGCRDEAPDNRQRWRVLTVRKRL
jgi:hypothetical protein